MAMHQRRSSGRGAEPGRTFCEDQGEEREKHFEERVVETGRGGVEVVDEENSAVAEVAVAQSDDVGVMNALPRIQNHRLSHYKKAQSPLTTISLFVRTRSTRRNA